MSSLSLIFNCVFIVGLQPTFLTGDAVITIHILDVSYVMKLNSSYYRSKFYDCLGHPLSKYCVLHLRQYSWTSTLQNYFVTSVEQINNSKSNSIFAYECNLQNRCWWNTCSNNTLKCERVLTYNCLNYHACGFTFFEIQWNNNRDYILDDNLPFCQYSSLYWCNAYRYVTPIVTTSATILTSTLSVTTLSEHDYTNPINSTILSNDNDKGLSPTHIAIIVVVIIIVVIVLISVSFYCIRKKKALKEARLENNAYVNDLALERSKNLNNNNVLSNNLGANNVDTNYTQVYDQYRMSNHTLVDSSLPTEVCSNNYNTNASSNLPRKGNIYNNTDTGTGVPLNKDYSKLGETILKVAHHDYNSLLPEISSSQEFTETSAEELNVNTFEVTAIQKADLPITDTSANPYELARII